MNYVSGQLSHDGAFGFVGPFATCLDDSFDIGS